jgi:hypothetical protein
MFKFVPAANTTFLVNEVFGAGISRDGMIKKYRQGDWTALNIFIVSRDRGKEGSCSRPTADQELETDGCLVAVGGLPRADKPPNSGSPGYNLGLSAVHEVGHWFNLLHPFESYKCDSRFTCLTTGDLVCDTPEQSSPSETCLLTKDTCPGNGPDNMENHMDYSPHTW